MAQFYRKIVRNFHFEHFPPIEPNLRKFLNRQEKKINKILKKEFCLWFLMKVKIKTEV